MSQKPICTFKDCDNTCMKSSKGKYLGVCGECFDDGRLVAYGDRTARTRADYTIPLRRPHPECADIDLRVNGAGKVTKDGFYGGYVEKVTIGLSVDEAKELIRNLQHCVDDLDALP